MTDNHPRYPQDSPLIAFVKALAIRQARLDARPPLPANENEKGMDPARKQ